MARIGRWTIGNSPVNCKWSWLKDGFAALLIGRLRLTELFERIKYLKAGTPEVPIVACRDGQPMPPGGRRDIAIFDRHPLAGSVEQALLLCPNMRNGHLEPVNTSL